VTLAGKTVLDAVSFDARAGESITIIGRNGAGKSTLLKCIGGMVGASSGRVSVQGNDVAKLAPKERARLMAYVPQSGGLVLSCTAFEFVLMARYAHFKTPLTVDRSNKQIAHEAMETTGTAAFRDRRLTTLSGGERQKVFIAAALAQGAPILLLDEPAAFLDYHHETELVGLIHRLNKESGLTVLSVSHDLNQGALECDRVVALDRGKVVFSDSPEHLATPEVLQSIYHTAFDVVAHTPTGRSVVVPLWRRP
jgi:iron complex transport system ATP-binding protein